MEVISKILVAAAAAVLMIGCLPEVRHRVSGQSNQLAKMIVGMSTGNVPEEPIKPTPEKNAATVALSRLGGLTGALPWRNP